LGGDDRRGRRQGAVETRPVTTAAELVGLLDSPYQAVIFIPGSTHINMAGYRNVAHQGRGDAVL
jgi:hypothetical protein